jgi:hypothetical protein
MEDGSEDREEEEEEGDEWPTLFAGGVHGMSVPACVASARDVVSSFGGGSEDFASALAHTAKLVERQRSARPRPCSCPRARCVCRSGGPIIYHALTCLPPCPTRRACRCRRRRRVRAGQVVRDQRAGKGVAAER